VVELPQLDQLILMLASHDLAGACEQHAVLSGQHRSALLRTGQPLARFPVSRLGLGAHGSRSERPARPLGGLVCLLPAVEKARYRGQRVNVGGVVGSPHGGQPGTPRAKGVQACLVGPGRELRITQACGQRPRVPCEELLAACLRQRLGQRSECAPGCSQVVPDGSNIERLPGRSFRCSSSWASQPRSGRWSLH
jgi:hypothetical protein